jgi:hypothetical protein
MCCALGRAHIEQGSDVVRGELLDLDRISNASVAQGAGSGGAGSDCREERSLQLHKMKKRPSWDGP